MPQGDRTGPQGLGPMTGRRMGRCAGAEKADPGFGWGFFRRGRGFGRGFGFFGHSYTSDATDEAGIRDEIRFMKGRLSFLEGLLGKKKPEE